MSSAKLTQILFLMGVLFTSCGKDVEPTYADIMKKNYVAKSVSHDGYTVYTQGGNSNIVPEYITFRLNLSTPGTVAFKDITSQTFNGNYSIEGSTLTLSNLDPQPTGSNGTIAFTINEASKDGSEVTLTRTTQNPKTANTVNVYKLVAQ